jgi:hypothetical protein
MYSLNKYRSKKITTALSVLVIAALLSFVTGCEESVEVEDYKVTFETDFAKKAPEEGEDGFEEDSERDTGEPVTESYTFTATEGDAVIRLFNGGIEDPDGIRISSATVTLNGDLVFGPSDFNQQVEELEADIALLEGDNTIEVTLRSKPGGVITIQILQAIEDAGGGGE